MKKILLISGPTASGKTKLALKLAREFNGEIISADSRQVYRQMDIVTGKDIKNAKFHPMCHSRTDIDNNRNQYRESIKIDFHFHGNDTNYNLGFYILNNIPIYGLDLIEPNQSFDVSDFVKIAHLLISYIQKKDKLPIIVGGTAFWLKNLLFPAATIGVPTNLKLRQELGKLTLQDLQNKLKKLNPKKFSSLNNSDINNPRRLIRAIEISNHNVETRCNVSLQNNQCHSRTDNSAEQNSQYRESIFIDSRLCGNNNLHFLWLSLKPDPKSLQSNISDRVEERIKSGAIKEAQKLASQYSWELPSMSAIGYKDLKFYLEKKHTLEETKMLWILHELQYAKRQLTFLKKIPQIKWFDLQESDSYAKINLEINKFLRN